MLIRWSAICLVIAASTGTSLAQVSDGDVLVPQFRSLQSSSSGDIWAYDPSTNTWSTVFGPIPTDFPNGIAMAPNNTDFVMPYVNESSQRTGMVLRVTPAGQPTTLASLAAGILHGLDLDFDGTWLGVGGATGADLIGIAGGVVNTLFTGTTIGTGWNEMTIDRDPGAPPYVIARLSGAPHLIGSARGGVLVTLNATISNLTGIELRPETGEYLCCRFTNPGVYLVNKSGAVVRSFAVGGTNGAKVNKDGTAWVAGLADIKRIDLNSGAVVLTTAPTLSPTLTFNPTGIEVYGSRYVTCTGTGRPGTSVAIGVSSRKPIDANAGYQLACSFARRPALSIPSSRDRLCLAADALFRLSASNTLPTIFQNFAGRLDAFGVAPLPVRVRIPASLPRNLGLSVFVSGVSFGPAGIHTVFNTHWFVIN